MSRHSNTSKLDYVRFRHWLGALWAAYGEHGLGKEHAAVWLYGETLTRYRVRYQPNKKRLRAVEGPHPFENPFRSPQ
jgi:hypothetical protein